MSNSVSIRNSSYREKNVLLFLSEQAEPWNFEAVFDADPDFQRCKLYTTSDLQEAKKFLKSFQIGLAIFSDAGPDQDFVFVQNEFRNCNPDINLIPLVKTVLTIPQIQASRKVGGIYTYGTYDENFDYLALKGLVIAYLREELANGKFAARLSSLVSPISTALNISQQLLSDDIKNKSEQLIDLILCRYDLTDDQNAVAVAANKIYFPSISVSEYTRMLTGELKVLVPVLGETGSWVSNNAPKSTSGFAVTLSHYLAREAAKGSEFEYVQKEYAVRPDFLKHVSMRAIDEVTLAEIYFSIFSEGSQVSNG